MTQSVHESNRIGLQLTLLVNSILLASVLKGKNLNANKILFVLFGGLQNTVTKGFPFRGIYMLIPLVLTFSFIS
jgi:hypothetical protein